MKKTYFLSAVAIIAILILSVLTGWFWASSKPPDPEKPEIDAQSTQQVYIDIEAAVLGEVEIQKEGIPLALLYDTKVENIQLSNDTNWATAWMTPVDPETGLVVPTEPGLVILRKDNGVWIAFLPSDPLWMAALEASPDDLIPPQNKITYLDDPVYDISAITAPFTGYYLPWAGGETMALTQSVGHDRYTPSGNAHYAFDFAKQGYPSGMFDVYASRSGKVKQAVWTHENGNETYANYMVIEDTSTVPTTYQLYLHFAKDSIPAELRVIGAPVAQGQFIGVADDTGISSGNHLHFMVHTNPASYWGTSVDITFNEVAINGGRPRISSDLPYCWDTDVCDQTQYLYVSSNFISPDHTPPTGNISSPPFNINVESNILGLQGWATDDISGLATAQFTARYNGEWHPVGDEFTTESFSMDWDLCADQVPDGPVSLALDLWDRAFNHNLDLPGLRHFSKNVNCPPPTPTCVPSSNQVALFANSDFRGACVVLSAGSYTSADAFSPMGINNADSIQVGSSVLATLYDSANLNGRGETFSVNDSNLSDNRIGTNQTESLRVRSRSLLPNTPTLVWPDDGAIYNDLASFSLVWDDGGGSTQFQARLHPESGTDLISEWSQNPFLHLQSIPANNYTWQVRARNATGESTWSSSRNLIIQTSALIPNTVSAPYEDDIETLPSIWTRSPFFDLTQDVNHTPNGSISWKYDTNTNIGYDTGDPNSGYLTSPLISLPTGNEYYLRFWYYYETEGPGVHWDQRWVQISVDGGDFTNVIQLSDDVSNYWLQSPAIPLGDYSGHSIQIRFYFATMDEKYNQYKGWYIDDFSITDSAPANCGDNNNSFIDAPLIAYNSTTNGVVCPGGDVDYYRFQGIAGDQIGARIMAQDIGSDLDSFLYLLDVDGRSILTENDDIIYAQHTDSWISYRLLRTGTYYLKVRSFDHPTSGDENHTYTLSLYKDQVDPDGAWVTPVSYGEVPNGPINLSVSVADSGSGISHVQFLWHNAEWKNSDWILLGDDWDGSDGWSFPFDATSIPTSGIAFYARAYDWAGNWIGLGAWNIGGSEIFLPLVLRP